MKFLALSTILGLATSASVSASEDRQLSALLTKWELSDPAVNYDDASNTFTFAFSKTRLGDVQQQATLYDYNCKDDGTGTYTEKEITSGATLTLAADPDSTVTLDIDTANLVKDPSVYFSIDDAFIQAQTTNPTYSSPLDSTDVGGGFMALCMRYGIGSTVDNAYKEVNFIETLIEIKYDLTAGFTVAGFGVAPKERVVTTQQKAEYNLVAYLCSNTQDTSHTIGTGARSFGVPADTSAGVTFNQGALITVCVFPDNQAIDDGILMTGITSFSWSRTFGSTVVTQPVLPLATNGNGLSAETPMMQYPTIGGGNGYVLWVIESILFAEYYKTAGLVGGAGQATLAFASRRRMLKGADGNDSEISEEALRRLQDGAEAEFDLSVDLTEGAEGPGALRTAGGASVGVTFLGTVAAVVSAALLA